MTGERDPYPYETHLDVLHGPLERVDVRAIAGAVTHPWWNQTLCQVNDSVVRLGIVQGEYHWHVHDDLDEFFFVLDGLLLVDIDDAGVRTVELLPQQGVVVPKGVRHRTRAPQRTVMLMVEGEDIVPTGDG